MVTISFWWGFGCFQGMTQIACLGFPHYWLKIQHYLLGQVPLVLLILAPNVVHNNFFSFLMFVRVHPKTKSHFCQYKMFPGESRGKLWGEFNLLYLIRTKRFDYNNKWNIKRGHSPQIVTIPFCMSVLNFSQITWYI